MTKSERAGKESIKKVVNVFVSPQKDFDRHDKKNSTYTTYEKWKKKHTEHFPWMLITVSV